MTKCIPESPDDCLDSPSLVKKTNIVFGVLMGSILLFMVYYQYLIRWKNHHDQDETQKEPSREAFRSLKFAGLCVLVNWVTFVGFSSSSEDVEDSSIDWGYYFVTAAALCLGLRVGYVILRDAQQKPQTENATTSSPPHHDHHNDDHCEKIAVSDKYQDLSVDMVALVFVALAQGILMGTFCAAAFFKKDIVWTHFDDETNGILSPASYYALGAAVQIGYLFSNNTRETLKAYSRNWSKILRLAAHNTSDGSGTDVRVTIPNDNGDEQSLSLPGTWELYLRFFLAICINLVGFWAVLLLLPLLLANSEKQFEFVLNSVAAWFIIELDNVDQRIMVCQRHDNTGTPSCSSSSALPGGTAKQDPATDHRSSVLAVAAGDASTSTATQEPAANDHSFSNSFSQSGPITTNRPSAALSVISL